MSLTNEKSLIDRLEHEIANPDTSGAPYVNDPDLLAECLAEIKRLSNAHEPAAEQPKHSLCRCGRCPPESLGDDPPELL